MTTNRFTSFSIVGIALLAGLAGCSANQNNPQEVKERTAQATAEIKSDAKAVAEGVREGWTRDKPLDLNNASNDQLVELPGITKIDANKIVAGRPYDEPHDLVARAVLPKAKYDAISDRITVKK